MRILVEFLQVERTRSERANERVSAEALLTVKSAAKNLGEVKVPKSDRGRASQ